MKRGRMIIGINMDMVWDGEYTMSKSSQYRKAQMPSW